MPTYGLKYQTQFTSESDKINNVVNNPERDYTLQFLFKDYSGEVATLTGAETTVIQRCTVDDPLATIKGQSLDISILNKGNVPISAFQSDDDDGVQVKLFQGTDLKFVGFLVQDDFYEPMFDYTHPIQLSANDGLGLLKGVILSEAEVSNTYSVILLAFTGLLDLFYVSSDDASFNPVVGGTIEILGVTYDITTVIGPSSFIIGSVNYNYLIRVTPNTPGWATATTETVILTGPLNLRTKNKLSDIIYACINQTNLELLTNIYFNLYEYRQDNTRSTLEQTLIDSQTFISGDSYQDCYTVLTRIMETFNLTLFQANGQWNIIHWYEAKYYSNAIPGFIYDEQFKYLSNTVFNNIFAIGPTPQLTRPKAGLTQGALRGYKFTKKKFDFKQPKYLLQNYDLLTLGSLIRQYVSGIYTYYEYVAAYWELDLNTPTTERFIRVIKETSSNTEVDRCLVVKGVSFNDPTAVQGTPFEISEGDKVKFSFSFQTADSQPGPGTVIFAVRLTDGVSNKYVDDPAPTGTGQWVDNPAYSYQYLTGDNTNTIQSVEIESAQAPFSGMLYVYLAQADQDGTVTETWYRDIRMEYQPYITDSVKVIGQTHKQERLTGPKLFDENDIYIDDSPRNGIAGTLFLNTKTGLIQDRTTYWRYPPDANGWRLGELTTLETLTWRQTTRTKYEGGFIGNYQGGISASLLTLAVTDFFPTETNTFGLFTIDYKRNQFSGTLWELYDSNDPEFDPDYEFKYLYQAD